MNKSRIWWSTLGCSFLCFVLLGCKTRPKEQRQVASKDILAKVGDQVITKKDMQQALLQMSPYMRNQYTSFTRRKELLMQLVEFEVLVLEARKQKLQETVEVNRLRKRAMARLLLNRVVQKVRPVSITDAAISAYYKSHSFKKPEVEVQEMIRHTLLQRKRNAVFRNFLSKLRKKYKVTINRDMLSKIPMIRKAPAPRRTAKAKPSSLRRVVPVPTATPRPLTPAPTSLPTPTSLPAPTRVVPTSRVAPLSQPALPRPSSLPAAPPVIHRVPASPALPRK